MFEQIFKSNIVLFEKYISECPNAVKKLTFLSFLRNVQTEILTNILWAFTNAHPVWVRRGLKVLPKDMSNTTFDSSSAD